ncbi:MAG TPA: hypothetical protein EYP14_09375 [Planctomycetaceae bacterium]|nr:hypothetical protein [Planctomycetaceae bacterium]
MFPFAHLYNVQRGRATGPWTADWKLKSGDGLHVRLTIVDGSGSEVNLCDGRSPAGGPYEMKWIMLHHRPHLQPNQPARTQIVSLIEPHFGTPAIRRARPLRVLGDAEFGFSTRACQVQLDDTIDTLLFSGNPETQHQVESGIRFSGRFGFWREKDGLPVAITLVGGTELSKGRFGVRLQQSEYRGRIIRVDRSRESVTIAPALENPTALVGEVVFIANEHRRVAYKVVDAVRRAQGTELRLNWDSCIGVGRSTGTTQGRVLTDTAFTLQGYRYYHGARLVSPDGQTEYRILGVRSRQAVYLDLKKHPESGADRLARQFPKGTWFAVYDYGVGDELIWPYAVSVVLEKPNRYRVTAPVPVKVQLPDGAVGSRGDLRE